MIDQSEVENATKAPETTPEPTPTPSEAVNESRPILENEGQQIAEKKKNIYELQDSIRDLIAEYKSGSGGDDATHAILLESAIKIQTRQLNPEIENLRLLQYEIMEMENTSYNVGGWGGGGGGGNNRDVTGDDDGGAGAAADKPTANIKEMNRLVQYPVSLQKMEIKIN